MEIVTSRRNVLVARFRFALDSKRRSRTHLLLAGRRLIDDARRAGVVIETVVVTAEAVRRGDAAITGLVAGFARDGVRVAACSGQVMAALTPLRSPASAVALARHRPPSIDDVLARAPHGCLLAPVGVQDPGNLGAVIRAAEAAGAGGVVVTGAAADPFGWKALRGAMGSTFRLPVADAEAQDDRSPQVRLPGGDAEAQNDDLLQRARRAGCTVLSAAPRGGRSIYDLDLTRPLLILIGGEGAGVQRALAETADAVVSIPMAPGVESLNAAVAAGVLAYEVRRQRTAV